MNPVIWLGLALILPLLAWDWSVKKRRIARRPRLTDQEFLEAYVGTGVAKAEGRILEVRSQIARELSLPVSLLRPEDSLTDLRDSYCLAVSGYLALGDLLDDLESAGPGVAATESGAEPETVRDYIATYLESSGWEDEPPTP